MLCVLIFALSRVLRQPILADEIQTFKALITIHKVLQEGHPIVIKEAQQHVNWLDTLMRGVGGEGIRGMLVLATTWTCSEDGCNLLEDNRLCSTH